MKLSEALEKIDPHGCDEEVLVIVQAAKDLQTVINLLKYDEDFIDRAAEVLEKYWED